MASASKAAHSAKVELLSASDELARYVETIETQTKALRSLFNIASILAEQGSFTELVDRMLEEVQTVLEVDSADLRMPDTERAGLRVVASVGSAQQRRGAFRAYGDSRSGRAFQLGEPIIAHDFEVNHRGGPERGRRFRLGYEAQSVAWLPVKADGRPVGVLAVDTVKRNHFTAERLQLLTSIADATGVFLENAKLREAERLRIQELELLSRAASIFGGSGSFEAKLTKVLKTIVGLGGDWVTLRMFDKSRKTMRLVVSTRPRSSSFAPNAGGISAETFRSKQPIVLNDYAQDRQAALERGVKSRAGFPIMVNGRPCAVLVCSSLVSNFFTPGRVGALATIATGIGPSLERARLESEARRRERASSKTVSQLQIAQERLIQSAKLAAVGELVTGVAREIHDPLAEILSHTESLLRSDASMAPAETLELIHAEANRVDGIVQNLLSITQGEKLRRRPMSMNGAVSRVIELRSSDLKANRIEVIVDLDVTLPLVTGDVHQMEQVFLNIIANAQHAMSAANDGGRLEIRSRRLQDAVQITFTDDGPGIPARSLRRVFDPFFTTNGEGQGAGLGLTLCHSIVQEHGGVLWVRSPRRNGTAVGVELPLPNKALLSGPSQLLTGREIAVLGLMAQGLSNREIAASLSLSLHTVKTHVSSLLHKLEVPNRTSAVRIARASNLVD